MIMIQRHQIHALSLTRNTRTVQEYKNKKVYKLVMSELIILTFITNEHNYRKMAVYIYIYIYIYIYLHHIHYAIIVAVIYILQ